MLAGESKFVMLQQIDLNHGTSLSVSFSASLTSAAPSQSHRKQSLF